MAEQARTIASNPGLVLVVSEEGFGAEMEAALAAAGYRVLRASTVSGAIQACMEEAPDLAVVELALAHESGLALLQFFRQLDTTRHVSVLMISGRNDEAERIDAFAQECDDFVVRPVSVAELLARARRHLALGRRIDALLGAQARFQEESIVDGLTQLHNHRAFHQRLLEEFRRAQRYDDPLALIVLDLDHFRQVNERFDHAAGDEILRALSECLRRAVRDTDILARFGGEEFSVILPKTHLAGALTVAERVAADVRRARWGPRALSVTASLGLSSFPGRGITTSEQLLLTAEEALQRAKREGRNRICLHQTSIASMGSR